MPHDIEQNIRAALDLKIKAPVSIDARLPDVLCFVVLLGAEGRVAKIFRKICDLLLEYELDTIGRSFVTTTKAFCSAYGH